MDVDFVNRVTRALWGIKGEAADYGEFARTGKAEVPPGGIKA